MTSASSSSWPASSSADVPVDVSGYRAVVRTSTEGVHRHLRTAFQGFATDLDAPFDELPVFELDKADERWRVAASGKVVHEDPDFLVALGTLEFQLLSAALDGRTDRFQLHGAALCAPTRASGLVVSGDSGIGKTTLAMALMLRGFTPFSDDVAVIEPDSLLLLPLRRAFHINADTWPMLEPLAGGLLQSDPQGTPGYFQPPQWATSPVPVRWVLFPERTDGPPGLMPLQPAQAAAAILAQTGTLAVSARLALATAAKLVDRARCFRLYAGGLEPTVRLIQDLVRSD